jgi:hypothetical protein
MTIKPHISDAVTFLMELSSLTLPMHEGKVAPSHAITAYVEGEV